MLIILLQTVSGVWQTIELFKEAIIWSLLFKVLLVKVLLLFPTCIPLSHQWYIGAAPPLTGVAVKVTGVPAQMLLFGVLIVTDGITDGSTIMEIILLFAVVLVTQDALLVSMQLTWSPLFRVLVENAELFVPAFTLFIFH